MLFDEAFDIADGYRLIVANYASAIDQYADGAFRRFTVGDRPAHQRLACLGGCYVRLVELQIVYNDCEKHV